MDFFLNNQPDSDFCLNLRLPYTLIQQDCLLYIHVTVHCNGFLFK